MFDVQIDRKVFTTADGTQRPVLHNITFSIARGEVIALLGAFRHRQKHHAVRILLGLDTAFEGRIAHGTGRAPG